MVSWNGWESIEVLGAGGQGEAHRVRRIGTDDTEAFVLKALKHKAGASAEDVRRARKRMRVEVESLRVIKHARVLDIVSDNTHRWESDEDLYFVTPFIEGVTLDKVVPSNGSGDLNASVAFSVAVLDALDAAHAISVVHRDLKPENLLLRDGKVVDPILLDFGIAAWSEKEAEGVSSTPTRTGEQFRNSFLTLPELQPGNDQRSRVSDLSHVAGLFLYVLTGAVPVQLRDGGGAPPHRRGDARSRLIEVLSEPQLSILDFYLDQMFQPDTSRRLQTAAELRLALMTIANPDQGSNFEHTKALLKARVASSVFRQSKVARTQRVNETRDRVWAGVEQAQKSLTEYLHFTNGGSHLGQCGSNERLFEATFTLSDNTSGISVKGKTSLRFNDDDRMMSVDIVDPETEGPPFEVGRTQIAVGFPPRDIEDGVADWYLRQVLNRYPD